MYLGRIYSIHDFIFVLCIVVGIFSDLNQNGCEIVRVTVTPENSMNAIKLAGRQVSNTGAKHATRSAVVALRQKPETGMYYRRGITTL